MSIQKRRGWLSCPSCEAACRDRPLSPRTELRCRRCGVRLKKRQGAHSLQAAWAFATAGLIFLIPANVEPVLTFDVAGNTQSNLIVTGVFGLFAQGYWPVALLVFFGAIAAPALHLTAVWYVLAVCCVGLRWPGLARVFRIADWLESWNLVPVYAVATLVAVVKLDMLGKVEWQQGALWVVALSLCSLLTVQIFDRQWVEARLEELA